MQEVCFLMIGAVCLMLFAILRELKKIEKKIEDVNQRSKAKKHWGWGK